MKALFLALLLPACGAAIEPMPLPPTCEVKAEYIRVQLCPAHEVAVLCSNVEQTNFDPAHCGGPDWTEGRQTSGNAWCCDYSLDTRFTKH